MTWARRIAATLLGCVCVLAAAAAPRTPIERADPSGLARPAAAPAPVELVAADVGSIRVPAVVPPGTRPRTRRRAVLRVPRPTAPRIVRGATIALTFDDGPDPRWTPTVLALLAKAGARATFCMIGREAVKRPDLVRAVVAAGHALCDHTYDHDEHVGSRSGSVMAADVGAGRTALVTASGGTVPAFFRAPGGNWTRALSATATRQGMADLSWTDDPRDWSEPGVSEIVRVVLKQARAGGIVLLHDGGGDRSQTIAALRTLLVALARRGYAFTLPNRAATGASVRTVGDAAAQP